jgi:hypothetical protein
MTRGGVSAAADLPPSFTVCASTADVCRPAIANVQRTKAIGTVFI